MIKIGVSARVAVPLVVAMALLRASCATPAQEADVYLTIVGPRAWLAELEQYAVARAHELRVSVVAWEELVKADETGDAPEQIKRFLFQQWQKGVLNHVLLVGNASITPVRYMVLDRATPPAYNYAFYACDLYYADLAKRDGTFDDWNARADSFHKHYFGEIRGEANKADPINFDQIDYIPEIGIGRWPVGNIEELRVIAKKTLQREQRFVSDAGRAMTAGLIAVDGWIDSRGDFDRLASHLRGWRIEKRYYVDQHRNDGTLPPNDAEILALFGTAHAVLFHAGHGHPAHWHDGVSLQALLTVNTEGQWPIVLSAGCNTAVFAPQAPYEPYLDIHGARHQGTNAGEVFLEPPPPVAPIQPAELTCRSMGTDLVVATPHGAVAYFGCATGSQPCALTLLEGFAKAMGEASPAELRLGDAYRKMIQYYVDAARLDELRPSDSWYPPSIFFQGMKFMMFGDPTLHLRSR